MEKIRLVFAETDGVNMQMGPNATCSDFFNLYFTKEFWELLVTETNHFAVQFFENYIKHLILQNGCQWQLMK